jgi:hypothetical protein
MDIGFHNCGRFKEIRPDLLSNSRKSRTKYLAFNYSRNFG